MEKVFKFGQSVYVAIIYGGSFELAKGKVIGVFSVSSAVGKFMYSIETCRGVYSVMGCEIFESVEQFKEEVSSRVIE